MGYVKLNDYWDFLLEQEDKEQLFCELDDYMQAKEIFNKYVYTINLELSAYCNRKCSYCPIAIYPRNQEYMAEDLFDKILDDMEQIGYSGGISLNLFNEPLYDDELESKISRIKRKLPLSYVYFNSNGDRLTAERLETLWDSGLDRINITLQTSPSDEWKDEMKRTEFKRYLKRIGKVEFFEKRREIEGKSIIVEIPVGGNRKVVLQCNNWGAFGNDRGGY